jgi:hypothetical protein
MKRSRQRLTDESDADMPKGISVQSQAAILPGDRQVIREADGALTVVFCRGECDASVTCRGIGPAAEGDDGFLKQSTMINSPFQSENGCGACRPPDDSETDSETRRHGNELIVM